MKHKVRLLSLAGMLMAAGSPASADVVLSGPDANDGSYSTARLATTVSAGDTVNNGTLTGISVWGLLGGANAASPTAASYGAITTSTPAGDNGKNAILRYYLLATGANGASVISLGELDPSFGGTAATPDFVAYQQTGSGLLATPELVVPGAPGRDITGLTSLTLLSVPALPAGPGGVSGSVLLTGNVGAPGNYTKAELQNDFTPVMETVSGDAYTGVPLWTFLDATNSNVTNQIVITQGTDGYEVALSLAELDPALGGNPNDLLPYADTGSDFPTDGVARTILPNDNKHGRWESNLDFVDVATVPEPSSLAVIAVGAVAMQLLRRRGMRVT